MEKIFLKEEDIPSYKELIKDAFDIKCNTLLLKNSLEEENVRVLAFKEDDTIVASVMITVNVDPVKGLKIFFLDYVSVLSIYRGNGLGKMLIDLVISLAKKESANFVMLTSSLKRCGARKIYFDKGFKIKDTDLFYKEI